MKYFLILFIVFGLSNPIAAQDKEKNAYLDIFASQGAAVEGQEFDIAIRQTIREGWHTYWKNAGDSGEPLSIEWALPDGVTLSDIRYPTPMEIRYDPLVNYGFEGRPIYLQTVQVGEDFEGDEIILEGEAFWLVCQEICIPEQQNISLTLPIRNVSEPANTGIFESAKEAMPQAVDWPSQLVKTGQVASLSVQVPQDLQNQFTDVEIYPYDWGVMTTADTAMADIRGDGTVVFTKTADTRDFSELIKPQFVLKTTNNAYVITASTGVATDVVAESPVPFLTIAFFAFLGGIILNLMPCVFPVLSMKALSLINLSSKERRNAQASGLAYTAGIIVSFIAIAGLLIGLKSAGATIGWGFQLQNPYVVAALATLLFLIGLNLAGAFDISSRWVNLGARFTRGNDLKSSFFTGVLACIVATPCSAPFMASAIGYALTQNVIVSLLVFIILGFGLAFPYLLLCYIPKFQKFLPRPGKWMETFRQVLSFPMFASAIWLIWVLSRQSGDMALLYILALFLTIVFLLWLFRTNLLPLIKWIITLGAVIMFALYAPVMSSNRTPTHLPFTQERLNQALQDDPDKGILVNMTAAWCITCLLNERTSLSNETVKQAFKDENIIYMKGDWTNRDSEITQYLESFERNGVPLYVFYDKADENGERPDPEVLPQILTPSIVIETIKGETK